MMRTYELEVTARWEGTHGFGRVMLRPPNVDGAELDLRRPPWVDKTHNGSPLYIDVTPEEMAELEVGTLVEVRVFT